MFDQYAFGEKLKKHRKEKNMTQDEAAAKIGVSGQAVSKWEKGECLPDVYNLKLLGRLYHVSIDELLDSDDKVEKVVETIKIGEAVFEIINKPAAILAGRIIYAKDYADINAFHAAMGEIESCFNTFNPYGAVVEPKLPITDINMSINFWLNESSRGFGFVRETTTENQPDGVDIYKMPASLFIRAYTDNATARLISKENCDIWELFAYIRQFFMPAHNFSMADNGAQEMEVYDTAEHKAGYAYMPVKKA